MSREEHAEDKGYCKGGCEWANVSPKRRPTNFEASKLGPSVERKCKCKSYLQPVACGWASAS